jgi:hypothetical protein
MLHCRLLDFRQFNIILSEDEQHAKMKYYHNKLCSLKNRTDFFLAEKFLPYSPKLAPKT